MPYLNPNERRAPEGQPDGWNILGIGREREQRPDREFVIDRLGDDTIRHLESLNDHTITRCLYHLQATKRNHQQSQRRPHIRWDPQMELARESEALNELRQSLTAIRDQAQRTVDQVNSVLREAGGFLGAIPTENE